MKVFHVLGYLAEHYGGPPKVAISLGQSLHKLGVDVSWWATATIAEKREFSNNEFSSNIHLFASMFPYSWYYSPKFFKALSRNIEEADILHLHQMWDYPLFAAARLAKKHNKPYVITPHGIFSQQWRYTSFKKRLYLRLIAQPMLNRAACIHAITPVEISGFKKIGVQTPYSVIPNGVIQTDMKDIAIPPTVKKQWAIISNRPTVLFLGRLSPEKGLDILVNAWQDVVLQYPRAMLIIAGPDFNGHRFKIEKLVEKYKLQKNIVFTGMIRGKTKTYFLQHSDIYVQPSYSEGFSMSVLEAMAAGKPCVITESCNFPELEKFGAGKVVPSSSIALGSALLNLLALTKEDREEIGKRGREMIKNEYTWDIAGQKMLNVYQNILSGKQIPGFYA